MCNTEREPRQAYNTQRQIKRTRIGNNMTPGTQRKHRHRTINLEIRNYKYNTKRKQKPFKHVKCLKCVYYSMNTVTVGAHSIKKKEKNSKQIRKVVKRVPHPKFVSAARGNDLMLLKVRR